MNYSVGRQASKGLVSKRLHDFVFFFYFLFHFFFGGGGEVLIFLCSPFHQAIYLCISIYLFSTLIIELNIKLKLAVILFIFSCLKEVNS